MTQEDTHCTIFYSDGREEGPISTLVVKDLIQAGVIGPNDRIALEGESPQPINTHPHFAGMLNKGRSAGAVTAVKLSRRPRGTSSSTRNVKASPTRRRDAVSQLSARQPPTSSASNPAMMSVGNTPSQPIPTRRLSGSQPAIAAQASKPPLHHDRTKRVDFVQGALNKGPVALRDKLLMASLPDILGVDMNDVGEALDRAYVERSTQISTSFGANKATDERLAVADVLNILLKSYEILSQPAQRAVYDKACNEASRLLSFQNHVPFSFATEETLSSRSSQPKMPAISKPRPSQTSAPARRRVLQPDAATSSSSPSIPVITPPPPRSVSGLRKMAPAAPVSPGGKSLEELEDSTNIMSVADLAVAMASNPIKSAPAAPSRPAGELHVDISSTGEGEDLFSVAGGDSSMSADLSIEEVIKSIENTGAGSTSKVAEAFGFPQEALDKGPVALRDRLLMSSLPDVLGLDLDSPFDAVSKIYLTRSSQINTAFPPSKVSKEDKLAVTDILNILLSSNEILSDEARRADYKQASETRGRLLSFQNHVPFTFATDGERETPAKAPSLSRPNKTQGRHSKPAQKAKDRKEATSKRPPPKKKKKPQKELTKKEQKAKDKKKKEKAERKAQFSGGEWREKGDPFKGSLAFGIGEAGRGLKHVLPVYATGFLLTFVLVFVGIIGKVELELRPGDFSIYIRGGLLAAVGFLALLAIRRESPMRIGIAPKIGATILAIPAAIVIGLVASAVARFNVNAGTTYEMVVPLLLARAVGESIFFHGFITRTLLIEFKTPALALMLSSLMYGLYALTYPVLTSLSPFNVVYAIFIYAFGGGFTIALIYWRTRSVLICIICQFLIFTFAAYGGIQYAERIAAG